MNPVRFCLLTVFLGLALLAGSQAQAQLAIRNNIPVIVNNDTLKQAWTGGVEAPVWGQMDLNLDGLPDIVILDSYDSRLIPLINQGGNKPRYQFAPEYYTVFKNCKCEFWARFKDYDHDGDMDLFCSNNSNVSLYENRPANGRANMVLFDDKLDAEFFRGQKFDLFSSKVYLPDFADLDGDGDLDFLTWPSFLRNSPEIYLNVGVDSFNNADTMALKFITDCWGHFNEDAQTGLVDLHDTTSCALRNFSPAANGCLLRPDKIVTNPDDTLLAVEKHVGGTNLLIDMDADNVYDLLIGDIGVESIVYVHNCGTQDYAYMDSAQENFPVDRTPISIKYQPGLTYMDYDNDGIRDLMVGTYYSDEFSINKDPVMWYKNVGQDNLPDFDFRRRAIQTDEMEDLGRHTKPCFVDVNADGLQDLLVGSGGVFDPADSSFSHRLVLYMNTGDSNRPVFTLMDDDYLGTSSNPFEFPAPAVGDVDKDGDIDLLVGQQNGEIAFYENTAGAGQPVAFSLKARAYQGLDAGASAVPFLYDTDGDGDNDLLVGHRLGGVAFYRNTTSTNVPVYTFVTDKWGFTAIRDRFGRPGLGEWASPIIADIDNDQEPELVVGSLAGDVQIYEGIDMALLDTITYAGSLLDFTFGQHSSPAAAVLDSTGTLSFIVGTGRGGLMLANRLPYQTIGIDPVMGLEPLPETHQVNIYPNPNQGQFTVERTGAAGSLSFEVLDGLGRLVQQPQALLMGRNAVSLERFPAGMYYIRVRGKGYSRAYKVIRR